MVVYLNIQYSTINIQYSILPTANQCRLLKVFTALIDPIPAFPKGKGTRETIIFPRHPQLSWDRGEVNTT
jgi:hypothetical protein